MSIDSHLYPKAVCRHYMRGNCAFGEKCNYHHPARDTDGDTDIVHTDTSNAACLTCRSDDSTITKSLSPPSSSPSSPHSRHQRIERYFYDADDFKQFIGELESHKESFIAILEHGRNGYLYVFYTDTICSYCVRGKCSRGDKCGTYVDMSYCGPHKIMHSYIA